MKQDAWAKHSGIFCSVVNDGERHFVTFALGSLLFFNFFLGVGAK